MSLVSSFGTNDDRRALPSLGHAVPFAIVVVVAARGVSVLIHSGAFVTKRAPSCLSIDAVLSSPPAFDSVTGAVPLAPESAPGRVLVLVPLSFLLSSSQAWASGQAEGDSARKSGNLAANLPINPGA